MLHTKTLQFLTKLKKNNSREWFNEHRNEYDAAKENFIELVNQILSQAGQFDQDIAVLTYKDCIFRINRDVRFSKNKDPYKNNMAAYFVKGGKKSWLAGYYFHCEPGGKSFIGGGLYGGEPDQIKKVRQEIDYNWEAFKGILNNKTFKKTFGDLSREEGMSLIREPKGYDKDNPAIDYIKLKNFIVSVPISDEELIDKKLIKKIITCFATMQPLLHFLNRAMED
ncbi:MAG: TIGR02453 family protein [Sediminibacterium sp.]|nr:MAG: TIGR02453 family protein [Sediminibacterium sp.] [Sediminibacterium sp. FEMGT703S]